MNKMCIGLEIHHKPITRPPVNLIFPKGCIGIIFAFKTKKAARAFHGPKIKLREIEKNNDQKIHNSRL